ncbi:hypothetical protein FB451DRAFT_95207 [Mycena latifolia]|nr:hypothetical protein FB451DRAFT_95207 [Mycena latifolia]
MAVELSSRVRRRSLKVLLLPLFPRTPGFSHNPISSAGVAGPRASLPEDVLHSVVEQLAPIDILSLSLTSSHVRALLIPALYRTVHLRSSSACISGLGMLAKRPELCAHVRKLAVRPNYYLAWPAPDSTVSEAWVARVIEHLAPKFKRLRTFDWDGTEMPPDALWRTLRIRCPELTELFTNVGHQPLDPESELFNFDALTTFSLSVRHGLGDADLFPPHDVLPPRLWTMLLERCPDLTELTLCSFSASHRLFDLAPLSAAHWPQLTSLTLGPFGYNADFTLAGPPENFAAFLAAHPALTSLRLAWNFKRWMSPDDLPALALPPALEDFAGVTQQLAGVASSTLTTLDLMYEPLYSVRAPALCDALRALTALTSLELWVHVPDPHAEHSALWASLWAAAPGLEDLHFMCTTAFGKKPLTELARALRRLPRLRTFALTKGHRYVDESMRASAVRVFRALSGPSHARLASDNSAYSTMCDLYAPEAADTREAPPHTLTQVSVRWARAACRNHLKQEGTYERVMPANLPASSNRTSGRGAEKSRKAALQDGAGKDVLEAWERGLRAVGGAFERRYRFALPQR